ncbi:phage tail assembly chaperone [Pseudoalteromonas luteoviolacea]|uniref:phage tail assembly chaperone n=1 Tax=Pseudoalteromonas luteoviolacea TaxID=43657 RepID=UPI001F26E37D|nr:phage tail assembly chaperone [Pseudoalteromonas luteoviolacea]MCF6438164.1 phage tail assembly chaperone [Pseudoalteromonas luteoviolacea]
MDYENIVTEPHGEDVTWVTVRSKRDNLLVESDLLVLRALENTQSVPTELSDYRQALRDLPTHYPTPSEVVWPTLG